ncbi:MAG: prephenate dehydrogenase/arogenate dehydrogenase family protein, partial [Proteobacteria bacterium]|nr:prephenate dehydrogenase/arogenate dehydrogenase family protein [Pseudomonadota bacterium]
MSDPALFKRVALIGLGLIGSSIARRVKRDGLVTEIAGCARTEATRERALELGIVDHVSADPAEAAAGADLVILCSPVGRFGAIAEAIA